MDLIDRIDPRYSLLALTALLIAVLYPAGKAIPDPGLRRRYHQMQLAAFFGAVVGAKLAVLFGDLGWPLKPLAGGWRDILFSGRSVTGGLLGGLLAAEAAKALTGYPLPPNDRFAAVLPLSIAVGRIGCFLAGCCRGVPADLPVSVTYSDGVPRHPAQLYEAGFHVAAGLLFLGLVARGRLRGRVFSLYLVLYGAFRFATEALRETPKPFAGLSGYQLISATMVVVGLAFIAARTPRPLPVLQEAS